MTGASLKKFDGRFGGFFTDSVIYVVCEVVEALVPFFLLPILTTQLPPEQYGFWILFVATHSLLRPIVGLSANDGLRLRYFSSVKNHVGQFIKAASILTFVMAVLLCLGAYCFRSSLSEFVPMPLLGVFAAILTAALQSIFYLVLAALQFRHSPTLCLKYAAIYSAVSVIISGILIFSFQSWWGAVSARLLALSLPIIFSVKHFYVTKSESASDDSLLRMLRGILQFGIHYLPAGITPLVIPFVARLQVARSISVSEVGLLGTAFLFGSTIILLGNALRLSAQPRLFAMFARHKTINYGETSRLISMIAFLLVSYAYFLMLVGPQVMRLLMQAEPDHSYYLIGAVCLASLMQVTFESCQIIYQALGRISSIAIGNTAVAILAILFQGKLVTTHGSIGVVYGTALAYGLITIPYIAFEVLRNRCTHTGLT